jgi:hypothetical protein
VVTDTNHLIKEIISAFKDISLEDGIGLQEGNAIDDYQDKKFRAECRSNDEKNSWAAQAHNKMHNSFFISSLFEPNLREPIVPVWR